jgi:aryl-alcohol dehydrogenase-like predicted oxidoreductase
MTVTNKPSHIREYIEGTIERLGTTPDLYYLHRIDPSTMTADSACATLHHPADALGPDTPLEESIPVLDELRRTGKTKYIGLSECSAATLRKAHSSKNHSPAATQRSSTRRTNAFAVAKIDAVQAEYSAFETLHETDGLIDAARDLGVAYVAYGPLGHGWLVDDFAYNSPDDFAPNDGRRSSESPFQLPTSVL